MSAGPIPSPSPQEVRRERKARGLSQEAAARLIGRTGRHWQMIEAGTATIQGLMWWAWVKRAPRSARKTRKGRKS